MKLKVNKLTSAKTQLPIDYYSQPFCQPDGGYVRESENLGEFLTGDRIESSPYILMMKKNMTCEMLCSTNLGRAQSRGLDLNTLSKKIKKEYHHNWIVDNLPTGAWRAARRSASPAASL